MAHNESLGFIMSHFMKILGCRVFTPIGFCVDYYWTHESYGQITSHGIPFLRPIVGVFGDTLMKMTHRDESWWFVMIP